MTRLQYGALGVLISLLAVPAWTRTGTLVRQVPLKASLRSNPFEGEPRARAAGGKLFARECAPCHGMNGGGIGKAPPLNLADVQQAAPGALFWILRNGSLKRGMPSFAHLPEPQRWQIVTYLKTLKPH
jgi:mono/diheme cytochrome c family protein